MKILFFGGLLVPLAVIAWAWKGESPSPDHDMVPVSMVEMVATPMARVPVEIREKGSEPQWVYVQVQADSIPEPGMISLLAIAGIFTAFFRRR